MLLKNREFILQTSQPNKHVLIYCHQKSYHIFNKLNCKSNYLIYLMEYILCERQYIDKSETAFNLRLHNHRKDVHTINTPEADQHFEIFAHNFNINAEFTVI